MRTRMSPVLSLIIILVGCAHAPVKPNKSLCQMAESNVKQRLGPEFRRVIDSQLLHSELQGTYGCAIVYQMMDEELSEEFESDPSEALVESHMVAFLSKSPGQAARLLEVKRTRSAKSPVTVKLEAVEVTGDAYLDLVIVERAKRPNTFVDYQGLKIINGDPKLTSEILETSLIEAKADKTEVVSEWMVDNSEATPKLWLRGGDRVVSYRYSKTTRRLMRERGMDARTAVPAPVKTTSEAKTVPQSQVTPKPVEERKAPPHEFNASDLEPTTQD